MADRTTERFKVLIGPEDDAGHILDMGDVQLEEVFEDLERESLDS